MIGRCAPHVWRLTRYPILGVGEVRGVLAPYRTSEGFCVTVSCNPVSQPIAPDLIGAAYAGGSLRFCASRLPSPRADLWSLEGSGFGFLASRMLNPVPRFVPFDSCDPTIPVVP